jgi:ABC-2 type transport system permease protein
VALSNIRATVRKPGYWILALIALIPYVISGLRLKTSFMTAAMMGSETPSYAAYFYEATRQQEFWIFLTALVVAANIIAADIRANALLIYLSKPITKGDYLLGKWVGTFLPLFAITFLPGLLFYAACALGLFGDGFLHKEPSLIGRMVLAATIAPAVHASLLVGISSWSKSGRIAGAVYAGFYLVTGTVFGIIGVIQMRSHSVSNLLISHLSVGGAVQGLVQWIYHTRMPANPFRPEPMPLPTTTFGLEMLALCAGLSIVGIVMARIKIKAVEVVRG